jgi:hypothetical protein
LKEKIDVDDQNTNLLTFPADKLEIFVLKVFSKLPFFPIITALERLIPEIPEGNTLQLRKIQ